MQEMRLTANWVRLDINEISLTFDVVSSKTVDVKGSKALRVNYIRT